MPRRSEPPPQAPLALKEQRDAARSKIEARRRKGTELKAMAVQSQEQAEVFEGEYQKWDDYNQTLLTSLFTNDTPATEYRWSVSAGVIVGEESATARHRRRIEEIKAKLVALESLAERLEVIPLAPGVADAAEQGAASAQSGLWRLLHPRVVDASKRLFDDGHYADSVGAALKALNSEVKGMVMARGAPEMDGRPLMQRAFSPNSPLITLADPSTQTGRDMQLGYMELFAGTMSAIRNPKAHDNVVISQERAIHLLFLASMLWYTLDARPVNY